jgi:hypothetical protein
MCSWGENAERERREEREIVFKNKKASAIYNI